MLTITEFTHAVSVPLGICPPCGMDWLTYRPAYRTVTMIRPGLFPYFDIAADQEFESRETKNAYLSTHDLSEVGFREV